MKRLIYASLLLIACACAPKDGGSPPSAPSDLQGGGTGGSTDVGNGGNTRLSSEEDVLRALSNLPNRVEDVFIQLEFSLPLIQDPRIVAIIEEMIHPKDETKVAVRQDVSGSPYLPVVDGNCPHQTTGHEDASTVLGRLKSPICFNVTSLKRIPQDALKLQLIALAVHEHAHHFGFGEDDANLLQNFLLGDGKWILQNNVLRQGLIQALAEVSGRIMTLRSELSEEKIDNLFLCSTLGATVKSAENLSSLLYQAMKEGDDYDLHVSQETFDVSRKLYAFMLSADNYCLGSLLPTPMEIPTVHQGNRTELNERLVEAAKNAELIKQKVPDAITEAFPSNGPK